MFAYCFVPFRPFCRTEFRRERKLALNQLLHCFIPAAPTKKQLLVPAREREDRCMAGSITGGLVGRRCMKARTTTLVVAAAVSVARVSWIRLLGKYVTTN